MNKKIIVSFSATIILLLLLGFTAIFQMKELAEISQKIYKHPFTVTNATKSIDRHLVSMHRYMKDVALAKNNKEIDIAVKYVNDNEKLVYKEFDIIFNRYLGDKKDITHCYESFKGWKPIRDEVVFLMKTGKSNNAAEITKEKGAKYLASLTLQVEKMMKFANNKALDLQNSALKSEEQSIVLILIMLLAILIIVVWMLIVLIRNITENEKKIK
ncbi:MAG: MCP four helix bundle domain-containing protein, partial [Sulfurimonas sp.]